MKKITYLITGFILASSIVACDSFTPNQLNDMKGLEEGNKVLTDNFADKDFVSVHFATDDALSTNFGDVSVQYYDPAVEKVIQQSYIKKIGNISDPKPVLIQPKKYETFKQSEIDLALTNQKTTEALNAIAEADGAEYENFRLTRVEYEKKNGKLVQSFNVTMTKIGEGKGQQGRMIVTNYYETEVTVKEDGTLTFREK